MNDHMSDPVDQAFGDLVSVRDAARILRVSESTVWRWINEDLLPSYRVGRKRVYVKQQELTPLLRPARKTAATHGKPRVDLNLTPMSPNPLTAAEAIARAEALDAKYLASHGGELMPESWIDINEARDERMRDLE